MDDGGWFASFSWPRFLGYATIGRVRPNLMNASPFWRFLELTKPYRWRILFGVALIFVATLLMLPAPWILKLIIDEALPRKDMHLLLKLLVAFTVLFVLRAWLTLMRNRMMQFSAMRLVCDLRIKLFTHLQSLSLRYFDTNQTGRTIGRIAQDTGEVYNLTNGFIINIIADSVTVLCVLGFGRYKEVTHGKGHRLTIAFIRWNFVFLAGTNIFLVTWIPSIHASNSTIFPLLMFFVAGWNRGFGFLEIDSERSMRTVLFLFFSIDTYAAATRATLSFIGKKNKKTPMWLRSELYTFDIVAREALCRSCEEAVDYRSTHVTRFGAYITSLPTEIHIFYLLQNGFRMLGVLRNHFQAHRMRL